MIKKGDIRVVGYKMQGGLDQNKISEFWGIVAQKGGIEKLCSLMRGQEPFGVLGVCALYNTDHPDYYICVATDVPVPEGMEECTIPAADYAVFEAVGALPGSIQKVCKSVEYMDTPKGFKWLGFCIEVYHEGDRGSDDYRCEVWYALVPA